MLIQNSPAPKGSPMSSPVPGGSSGSSGGPSSKQAASGSGDITEKKITEKKGGDITSRLAFRVTIFLTLALQNASLVMLTRWTKMYRPEAHNPDNDANVVVWGEIVKLWISIGVVLYNVFLRNPFDSPEKITSEISDSDDAIHVAYSGGLLSTANIMKATGLKTEVPDGARRSTPGSLRLSSLSSKNWDCDDWEEQIIEWCLPPDVSKKDSDRDSASKEASQGKVLKPESQGKAETRQRRRPSQIAREESDQNPALAIELSATQKCVAGILNRVMKSPKQIKERYALLVRKQMGNGIEFMLMTIPGCIYLVQNRLIFFAYSKLPGPVFQVTYQLKILTGAFVARFVLKQILSWRKWFALALLVVGVVTVQVDGHAFLASLSVESATMDFALGILGSVIACLCSGCAGVYFEKVLKSSKVDLWVRNVHLAIASVLIGGAGNVIEKKQRATPDLWSNPSSSGQFLMVDFVPALWSEMTVVPSLDISVWGIILLHSAGGILVSLLIKYMDNTMKSFAASCAILISSLASVSLFPDFQLSPLFWTGFTLVAAATYLYMN